MTTDQKAVIQGIAADFGECVARAVEAGDFVELSGIFSAVGQAIALVAASAAAKAHHDMARVLGNWEDLVLMARLQPGGVLSVPADIITSVAALLEELNEAGQK